MSELFDRREFVARSSVGLAALLLVACDAGVNTAPLSGPVVVDLSKYAALANVGGIARVNETTTPVALERTGTSTFSAFSLICPHQGGIVAPTGNSSIPFQCPLHGSTFNAAGDRTSGPASSGLHKYEAVFDADAGTITIN